MAYWDSRNGKIVYTGEVSCAPEYPGWAAVDCGCCNGMEWNALEPTTCSRCDGNGVVYKHIASGALAKYPGGPYIGHA